MEHRGGAAGGGPPAPLDRETILAATEELLRRHGPAKTTVVDVARALGVSHGSVYRHVPSKKALREAAVRRWLARTHAELGAVAADRATGPDERLCRWLELLVATRRSAAATDPELFATFGMLAADRSAVVAEHDAELAGRLRWIVEDGMASGAFGAAEPGTTAQAIFDATARFHDPAHAAEWAAPDVDARCAAVCALVVASVRAGSGVGLDR